MNCYGLINGVLVPLWVGVSGIAATPDFWQVRSSPSSSQLNGIAYGNGLFIGVGSDTTILTSPNGALWDQPSAGTTAPTLRCAAFGNGRYVLGGGEGA